MDHKFKRQSGLTNRPDLVLVMLGDSCAVDGGVVSVFVGGFPGSSVRTRAVLLHLMVPLGV